MQQGLAVSVMLCSGEVMTQYVKRGTVIRAVSGCLVVRTGFQWLAEQMFCDEQLLHPQQIWRATDSGWIEMRARGAVRASMILSEQVCAPGWWCHLKHALLAWGAHHR